MSFVDHVHMMPMTVGDIAKAVNGELSGGNADDTVTSACSDSRQVKQGSVFVAMVGERVDGHDYVSSAQNSGAVAAIVEHIVDGVDIAQIVVNNCVEALGLLAQYNLRLRRASDNPFMIVGITGSVGKTTTKDMLHALLSTIGETVAPVGSFNNEIGLPLTALQVNDKTRFLVAEMGANHVGEIAALTNIAPPDVAVVLKVGTAHLGEFGSVERIAQAKSEIVRGLVPHGIAVLNADDTRVSAMANLVDKQHARWFGKNTSDGLLEAAAAGEYQLCASDIALDSLGKPIFTLTERNFSAKSAPNTSEDSNTSENSYDTCQVQVHLALPGAHNVMNALAAANVARLLGMNLRNIADVLSQVAHISPHRMQLSTVHNNGEQFTLIDDSFNANPDSMKAGIDGLCAYERADGRDSSQLFRIAVLGSMLELGGSEDELHEKIGSYVAHAGVDAVVAVGSQTDATLDHLAQCIVSGARQDWQHKVLSADDALHVVHSAEAADAVVWKLVAAHPSSVVLLKGSHASGLSVLAERWATLLPAGSAARKQD